MLIAYYGISQNFPRGIIFFLDNKKCITQFSFCLKEVTWLNDKHSLIPLYKISYKFCLWQSFLDKTFVESTSQKQYTIMPILRPPILEPFFNWSVVNVIINQLLQEIFVLAENANCLNYTNKLYLVHKWWFCSTQTSLVTPN